MKYSSNILSLKSSPNKQNQCIPLPLLQSVFNTTPNVFIPLLNSSTKSIVDNLVPTFSKSLIWNGICRNFLSVNFFSNWSSTSSILKLLNKPNFFDGPSGLKNSSNISSILYSRANFLKLKFSKTQLSESQSNFFIIVLTVFFVSEGDDLILLSIL